MYPAAIALKGDGARGIRRLDVDGDAAPPIGEPHRSLEATWRRYRRITPAR
jgi:hypothetical protein